MNRSRNRQAIFLLMVLASVVAGCTPNVEGVYQNGSGLVTVELKGGKAYLTMGALTSEGIYEVKGNQIVVRENAQDSNSITLTRDSDGSLTGPTDGPMGRLTKKSS